MILRRIYGEILKGKRYFAIFTLIVILLGPIASSYIIQAHAVASVLGVNLDAASISQMDTSIASSASNVKSFRVGAIVNATNTNFLSGVLGWQFSINYDKALFVPQG